MAPSESALALTNITRESNVGIGLNEAAIERTLVGSVPNSTLSDQPITFIDKLLVNGTNSRVPVAELHPGQTRILQCIAELSRFTGGFRVFGTGPLLCARIRFSAIRDVYSARLDVLQLRNQLIGLVNTMNPTLVSGGGNCKDIDAHVRKTSETDEHLEIAVVVEVPDRSDVQVIDNLIAKLAPLVEQLTNGKRSGASINDIAGRQLLCAQVTFDPSSFSLAPVPGHALAGRIVELHNFTCIAKERVNARNADILATANSTLDAIDSANGSSGRGRSPWTAHDDHGVPLAIWYRDHNGHLAGRICLPLVAEQAAHKIRATEIPSTPTDAPATVQNTHLLNPAVAAIGLAQSLANLHAHAAEAIAQRDPGQHAYDLALLVGARGSEIFEVVKAIGSAHSIRSDHAITTLDELRGR